jgi:hypothetical protein
MVAMMDYMHRYVSSTFFSRVGLFLRSLLKVPARGPQITKQSPPLLLAALIGTGIFPALLLAQAPQELERIMMKSVENFELKRLTEQGGRFDLYRGSKAHSLIAFDAVNDRLHKGTEVYLMDHDGTNVRCLTFDMPLRRGHIGNPVWHPNGHHLVVQVANSNTIFGHFNHAEWGIDNELWLIDKDGKTCERIFKPQLYGGALNPIFSPDGKNLLFAERVRTGKIAHHIGFRTPGGEDPWAGWSIHACRIDVESKKIKGEARLSHHRRMRPKGWGFYLPHQVTEKSYQLTFSYSRKPKPQHHEVYVTDLFGRRARNVTHWPRTYDSAGVYSPSEQVLAFASSRVDPSFKAQWTRPSLLKTEAYLRVRRKVTTLTNFNRYVHPLSRYYVSNLQWDRAGRRLFLLAEFFHKRRPSQPRSNIFVITFKEPL